jgi:hypothetical protein
VVVTCPALAVSITSTSLALTAAVTTVFLRIVPFELPVADRLIVEPSVSLPTLMLPAEVSTASTARLLLFWTWKAPVESLAFLCKKVPVNLLSPVNVCGPVPFNLARLESLDRLAEEIWLPLTLNCRPDPILTSPSMSSEATPVPALVIVRVESEALLRSMVRAVPLFCSVVVLGPMMIVPLPASSVKAPEVVANVEAALPVKDTAPPVTVMPALPVSKELKVLAPASVWAPVETMPAKEASAVCRTRELPTMTAPLVDLVWESRVPMEVTPEPEPPATSPITRHRLEAESYISVIELPTVIEILAPVPVVIRLAAEELESLLLITALTEPALTSVST